MQSTQKKQLITRKPAYRHGQLLLENDFIDEQRYHRHALANHVRALHGFGVVHGLEVTPSGAGSAAVSVSPGYAVDRKGREIVLAEPETLDLSGLAAGASALVTVGYRAEPPQDGREHRIDCYALVQVAAALDPASFDVRLASVKLDERGRLAPDAIGRDARDALRTPLAPESVTADALDPALRRGWIALAFHPSRIPGDENDARPPFRIGATQAQAHREIDGQPNARGAAGTMAIALPPGVRRIHYFRIAGAANEKRLKVTLLSGGFDPAAKTHRRDEVVALDIGPGAYCETVRIPDAHRGRADPLRTLAVDVRAEGFVKVSLVAIEVSY